jgi:hypothetical protein
MQYMYTVQSYHLKAFLYNNSGTFSILKNVLRVSLYIQYCMNCVAPCDRMVSEAVTRLVACDQPC